MAWLRVFWAWILPPPRGYRVTGTLLERVRQATQQLAVQRTNLGAQQRRPQPHLRERRWSQPAEAYRAMAGEAAKWLRAAGRHRSGSGGSDGPGAGSRARRPAARPAHVFDEALDILLPVRQQVNQGTGRLPGWPAPAARRREAMIAATPDRIQSCARSSRASWQICANRSLGIDSRGRSAIMPPTE